MLSSGRPHREPISRPHREPPPPPQSLLDPHVRTINMARPHDSGHGFGICVKGGVRDSGNQSPKGLQY